MGKRKGISDDYRRRWNLSAVYREDSLVRRFFRIAVFKARRSAAFGCEVDSHTRLSWRSAATVTAPLSAGLSPMGAYLRVPRSAITVFACIGPFFRRRTYSAGRCLPELDGGDVSEVIGMLVGCQKQTDGDEREMQTLDVTDNPDISPEFSIDTYIKWINLCPAK